MKYRFKTRSANEYRFKVARKNVMVERFELSVIVRRTNQKYRYEHLFCKRDFGRFRLKPNTVNDFSISTEFR